MNRHPHNAFDCYTGRLAGLRSGEVRAYLARARARRKRLANADSSSAPDGNDDQQSNRNEPTHPPSAREIVTRMLSDVEAMLVQPCNRESELVLREIAHHLRQILAGPPILSKSGPGPATSPRQKEAPASVPATKATVFPAPQRWQYPASWIKKEVNLNGISLAGYVKANGEAACEFFFGPGRVRLWNPASTRPSVPEGSAPQRLLALGADGRLHQV